MGTSSDPIVRSYSVNGTPWRDEDGPVVRIRATLVFVRVARSVFISKPTAEVFDWIADPDMALRWRPGVINHEVLEEAPGRVGTTFREVLQTGDGLIEMKGRVVGYEEGRTIASALTGGGTVVGTRFDVAERPGGCEVSAVVDLRIPGLMARLFRGAIERRIARQVDWELDMLRSLCEERG